MRFVLGLVLLLFGCGGQYEIPKEKVFIPVGFWQALDAREQVDLTSWSLEVREDWSVYQLSLVKFDREKPERVQFLLKKIGMLERAEPKRFRLKGWRVSFDLILRGERLVILGEDAAELKRMSFDQWTTEVLKRLQ